MTSGVHLLQYLGVCGIQGTNITLRMASWLTSMCGDMP